MIKKIAKEENDVEYYGAISKDEILSFATMWRDL